LHLFWAVSHWISGFHNRCIAHSRYDLRDCMFVYENRKAQTL